MKKRFVVVVASGTNAQNTAFIQHLKSRDISWWHWLDDVWLLRSEKAQPTAAELRDAVLDFSIAVEKGREERRRAQHDGIEPDQRIEDEVSAQAAEQMSHRDFSSNILNTAPTR